MASTNIQTFPGKVGVSNTNPVHTLDVGSNVYIDDTGANKLTVTGNIHASGITIDGDITIIDTQNLVVKDPIILLASESTGTTDTGIIMKRADGDSNVAMFYDEGVGLKVCHTMSSAEDTQLVADTSNALNTSIYGAVTIENTTSQALSVGGGAQIDGNFQVGEVANLFVDTTTSNVGIGTGTPGYSLDVVGDINLSGDFYQGGSPFVSSLWTSSGTDLYYNSGSVGISNAAPEHNLSVGSNLYVDDVGSNVLVVDGNVSVSNMLSTQRLTLNNVSISATMNLQQVTDVGNVTSNTVQFTNPTTAFVTTGNVGVGGELTVSGNVEVGTANLFVDTVNDRVGVNTSSPSVDLDVAGEMKVSANVEVGTANLFVDTVSGNVGVGTTNPTQKLDVRDGSAFIERDVIVNELDSLPALTTHGTLGREDLYTWEGSTNTIVNTANQQNEPFYYNSDSSFKRLQTVGTATFSSTYYTSKWNHSYMIFCDNMNQDSKGNITTPTNYVLLSLPVAWLNNKTSSHSLFLKFITRDRWSSVCAYVTNSSKTSFYRLQANTNTLNDSAETLSRNLWYGPDGGFSYGQSYHEWQMFSIPEHVIEEYSYSETRDGKSKYNRNINIAFTAAYGNTGVDGVSLSGIAMRTNPYGLTYNNALCAYFAINGGSVIDWYSSNWEDLGILGQITSGTNYTNILIPICPPKDPDVHGYPDFYLGYIGHRAQDQYEKRGRFYLQHSNGTYKYIGRPSHIYGGRFGKDILGMLNDGRCAPNNGLYVSIPSSDYIAKVGGRPYLRIRIDNSNTNGWTGAMHPLGFYTEVVYRDGSKDGLGDNGQQYI